MNVTITTVFGALEEVWMGGGGLCCSVMPVKRQERERTCLKFGSIQETGYGELYLS